ncbi:ATP-binding protein [Hymenobacter sp. J193]|uniref:ATP-dependent nuclease n=1 Tax=Hymenobacter sp. J193 TaxID=2898429 RepID=UPI002150CE1C|nr:ATP-binding protein [Hymenobacter sp. J193]MCR5889381.1 ATP-binding protein [Hymenobacter sp. J193]
MELKEIRIRNFRTVEQEQSIALANGITLVGPNSSGKTNILKAIKILFTGFENTLGYNRVQDLTFGQKNRTSIVAQFQGEAKGIDKEIYKQVDELHKLQGTKRSNDLINLSLYFTEAETPVYNIFSNVKRPTDAAKNKTYSRIHRQLVTQIIDSFCIYYVPASKSIKQLYEELLAPFLRQLAADAFEPHIAAMLVQVDEVAARLNKQLHDAGLKNLNASFAIPDDSLNKLLTNFNSILEDPAKTPLYEKGMGIQSTALIASFLWITQEQKRRNRKNVIWLLEEPESYLHPELSMACLKLLNELEKESLVVKTTHSLSFVPQDPNKTKGVIVNSDKRTEVSSFKTYADATNALRRSLGVRFSDFYNLDVYNVFVEGPSDREVFKWLLGKLPEPSYALPYLRKAQILDQGGVKFLGGFLRATYAFIHKERACVAVFDGDDAGVKEYRDLQQFFGQHSIPFEANRDFVVVRNKFALEGLFPDAWIIDIESHHKSWFKTFSVDASGELSPFDIHDNNKSQVQNELMKRANDETDLSWADRLIVVCNAIDNALEIQEKRLSKTQTPKAIIAKPLPSTSS